MVDLGEADLNQDEQRSIADRLNAGEPIREPELLKSLADANLPLRGPLRQRIVENARDRAFERRTIEGISNRVAANVAAPITEIIEQSIRERVQGRVQESVARMATNTDR